MLISRSGVNAQDVSVIPNAVDAVKFRPKQPSHKVTTTQQQSTVNTEKERLRMENLSNDKNKDESKPITIVIGSRLVYR